eukprot:COSAG02_NODE_1301_length_13367_cov_14.080570_8_plen_105_part_00
MNYSMTGAEVILRAVLIFPTVPYRTTGTGSTPSRASARVDSGSDSGRNRDALYTFSLIDDYYHDKVTDYPDQPTVSITVRAVDVWGVADSRRRNGPTNAYTGPA